MIPYDLPFITKLLRTMPAEQLGRAQPKDFQRWPGKVAIKASVIRDLITIERTRRGA